MRNQNVGLDATCPRQAGYVLVVDDDDELATALATLLERRGYRVVIALGGTQALAMMAPGKRRPCLVLLDWNMPEVGGRDVIEWMHSHDHVAGIVTYVVTSAPQLVPRSLSVIDKLDYDTILSTVRAHCHPREMPVA